MALNMERAPARSRSFGNSAAGVLEIHSQKLKKVQLKDYKTRNAVRGTDFVVTEFAETKNGACRCSRLPVARRCTAAVGMPASYKSKP